MRGVYPALSFAEQEGQVILDLLIPPAPVVIDVVAPEIHPCVNPLRVEHALDARGALLEHVLPRALTDAEDDFPEDAASAKSAKVTPIRQAQRRSGNGMEVCVIKPTSYEDSLEVMDTLLSNRSPEF